MSQTCPTVPSAVAALPLPACRQEGESPLLRQLTSLTQNGGEQRLPESQGEVLASANHPTLAQEESLFSLGCPTPSTFEGGQVETGRSSGSCPKRKWFTVNEDPSEIREGRSVSHGTLPRVWRLPRRQSLLGTTASPRLLRVHSPGLRSAGSGLSLPRKQRR